MKYPPVKDHQEFLEAEKKFTANTMRIALTMMMGMQFPQGSQEEKENIQEGMDLIMSQLPEAQRLLNYARKVIEVESKLSVS